MDIDKKETANLAWLSALLSLSGPSAGLQAGSLGVITFHILADLARIRNPRMLNALEMHLVQGWTRERACSMYGVNVSNFSRRIAVVNRTWQLTEALKTVDEKLNVSTDAQEGKNEDPS
ncbi:hypothetical protein AAYR83_003395 [Salmonella enterica]|uniref:Uncharacterized protein n=1 Tax=Salmonella enterica TaxID=28901 RepID=A0A5U2CK91_SALER|nr:PapB/FocB family fimbrial expression transcriptional regulator [Salmonella enterica]EED4363660.1 hypothetical protein [Salmonella enterica subsp. enterica]EEJ9160270.1 hypothetical protein [Salmonella enterica subsp. enterica serovar Rubislaw]EAO1992768.1 hypothetical protein [Salmonella enterica]EAS1904534.1 hypothetical protein [Salmonella enterica]EAX2903515.1 hypothetical protein [Salmonella enterica]